MKNQANTILSNLANHAFGESIKIVPTNPHVYFFLPGMK